MDLLGKNVWVPCEVKVGPFSDERVVRVRTEQAEWVGFAPACALKENISQGDTFIQVIVTGISGNTFTARPMGFGVQAHELKGSITRIIPVGALET